jgi:hypothetical protein
MYYLSQFATKILKINHLLLLLIVVILTIKKECFIIWRQNGLLDILFGILNLYKDINLAIFLTNNELDKLEDF